MRPRAAIHKQRWEAAVMSSSVAYVIFSLLYVYFAFPVLFCVLILFSFHSRSLLPAFFVFPDSGTVWSLPLCAAHVTHCLPSPGVFDICAPIPLYQFVFDPGKKHPSIPPSVCFLYGTGCFFFQPVPRPLGFENFYTAFCLCRASESLLWDSALQWATEVWWARFLLTLSSLPSD